MKKGEAVSAILKNAEILQTNIQRMANNSNVLKGLFLPFVGILLSVSFATALVNSSEPWFSAFNNRVIFGLLMLIVLSIASIIFGLLDYKYLKLERQLRSLYNTNCVKTINLINSLQLENSNQEITDPEILKYCQLIDLCEIKKEPIKCDVPWSIWLFYPSIIVLFSIAYFSVVLVVKLC